MTDLFITTPAERLATVYQCRSTGAWGVFQDLRFGRARVTGEGFDAFVTPGVNGWCVALVGSRSHFVGVSRDLEEAATLALEAGL